VGPLGGLCADHGPRSGPRARWPGWRARGRTPFADRLRLWSPSAPLKGGSLNEQQVRLDDGEEDVEAVFNQAACGWWRLAPFRGSPLAVPACLTNAGRPRRRRAGCRGCRRLSRARVRQDVAAGDGERDARRHRPGIAHARGPAWLRLIPRPVAPTLREGAPGPVGGDLLRRGMTILGEADVLEEREKRTQLREEPLRDTPGARRRRDLGSGRPWARPRLLNLATTFSRAPRGPRWPGRRRRTASTASRRTLMSVGPARGSRSRRAQASGASSRGVTAAAARVTAAGATLVRA
jgi:hypothetical protein